MNNEKRKELEDKKYEKRMKILRLFLVFQFLLSLYTLFHLFCRFYYKINI